jgi:hypothetical protein
MVFKTLNAWFEDIFATREDQTALVSATVALDDGGLKGQPAQLERFEFDRSGFGVQLASIMPRSGVFTSLATLVSASAAQSVCLGV